MMADGVAGRWCGRLASGRSVRGPVAGPAGPMGDGPRGPRGSPPPAAAATRGGPAAGTPLVRRRHPGAGLPRALCASRRRCGP